MAVTTSIQPDATGPSAAHELLMEEERLRDLTTNPPQEILVVSDFHLGRGRNPVTSRISRTENFLADETFARFLDYSAPGPQKLLFINGDTFDFVRMCEHPRAKAEFEEWSEFLKTLKVAKSPAELRDGISSKERK